MAAWVSPIVGKPYPKDQDRDRMVRKVDKVTVEVEVWKVDEKGITVGSKLANFPSDDAPMTDVVRIHGGEQVARSLIRQARFVKERASIGAKKGAKNGTGKGY